MFGIRYGFARRGISWPALHVVPASHASEVRETLSHVSRSTTLRTTPHSAHRDREDGLRTPVGVLTWVRGALFGHGNGSYMDNNPWRGLMPSSSAVVAAGLHRRAGATTPPGGGTGGMRSSESSLWERADEAPLPPQKLAASRSVAVDVLRLRLRADREHRA